MTRLTDDVALARVGQGPARQHGPTVEVSTNHLAMVSHPNQVLQLITTAAQAVPTTT
jgi:hypothetical protein